MRIRTLALGLAMACCFGMIAEASSRPKSNAQKVKVKKAKSRKAPKTPKRPKPPKAPKRPRVKHS